MEPYEVRRLSIRVNLRVVAIKEYPPLFNIPELEHYHQMQFSVTSWTST